MIKSVLISLLILLLLTPWAQASDGRFAPCTAADLETLRQLESVYDALLVQGTRTRNASLLRFLVERQYEWRLGLNETLPRCAEAFEIGWLMSQVTGDTVAVAALDLADEESGWLLEPKEIGRSRVAALLEDLGASLDDGALTPQSLDDAGAACSDEQLAILAPGMLLGFEDAVAVAQAAASPEAFVEFTGAYLELREAMWNDLPHCSEAVEFGLMMNQILGDYVGLILHRVNGVADEDNPLRPQIVSEGYRFADKTAAVVAALDRNRTVKLYHVSGSDGANIRACPTTACEIVAVYAAEQELRIIDDSGEWYEIRLDNGETGFIAGFLASINSSG
ncbi:MAG: SH3 domain-containing protein [Chloroflexi bacterium]|nr:SH3 domain-containing protein [Chloroflexota bacterium]